MKKKIVLSLLVVLIICSNCVLKTQAGYVNNSIRYSNDYFTNDSVHANSIKSYYDTKGYNSIVGQRASTVGGTNSGFACKTAYISTHGTSTGSQLQLASSLWYSTSDVPTSVSGGLIFLSACNSAKTNPANQNLVFKLVNNGAKVVLGYSDVVGVTKSRYFEISFYSNFIGSSNDAITSYSNAKSVFAAMYGTSDAVHTSATIVGQWNYAY